MESIKRHPTVLTLNISACVVFIALACTRLIPLTTFDVFISRFIKADGARFFALGESIGTLADPIVFIALTCIGALILIYLKKYMWALFFSMAMFGAVVSGLMLKEFFEVARPESWGPRELGWSFPSLHATAATVFFFSLVYAFEERIHAHALVIFWGAVFGAGALMVSFSRVYLGVHVVSDVLAGFALGVFWATLSIMVLEWGRSRPS